MREHVINDRGRIYRIVWGEANFSWREHTHPDHGSWNLGFAHSLKPPPPAQNVGRGHSIWNEMMEERAKFIERLLDRYGFELQEEYLERHNDEAPPIWLPPPGPVVQRLNQLDAHYRMLLLGWYDAQVNTREANDIDRHHVRRNMQAASSKRLPAASPMTMHSFRLNREHRSSRRWQRRPSRRWQRRLSRRWQRRPSRRWQRRSSRGRRSSHRPRRRPPFLRRWRRRRQRRPLPWRWRRRRRRPLPWRRRRRPLPWRRRRRHPFPRRRRRRRPLPRRRRRLPLPWRRRRQRQRLHCHRSHSRR